MVFFDELKDILIDLPVEDERIARIFLTILDDGELSIRLEHGTLDILDVVDARQTQFQREIMREEPLPHALVHEDFAALDEDRRRAVNDLLDAAVVRLDKFQQEHEERPRDEHEEEVNHRDGTAVDNTADDAAEHVVLHLIGRGRGGEVALAEEVDLHDETKQTESEFCEYQ